MNNTTKALLGVVGGATVVFGGIYLYRRFSKKSSLGNKSPDISPASDSTSSGGGGGHINTVYTPTPISPLSGSSAIKQFQQYANSKGENLSVDGVWGPMTASAWTRWGAGFNTQSSGLTSGKNKFNVGAYVYANKTVIGFDPNNSSNQRTFSPGSLVGQVKNVDASGSTVYYIVVTPTGSNYSVAETYLR